MWKKILSALGLIAVLIAMAIGGVIGKQVGKVAISPSKPTAQQVEDKIIEGFIIAANQFGENLPMMLDQDTRLDKVTVGPGPRAVYHHSFPNYTSRDIDENWLKTNLRPEVTRKVCASGDMKESLQYGGIYVYSYFGSDGIEIAKFEIDRNDCGLPKTTP